MAHAVMPFSSLEFIIFLLFFVLSFPILLSLTSFSFTPTTLAVKPSSHCFWQYRFIQFDDIRWLLSPSWNKRFVPHHPHSTHSAVFFVFLFNLPLSPICLVTLHTLWPKLNLHAKSEQLLSPEAKVSVKHIQKCYLSYAFFKENLWVKTMLFKNFCSKSWAVSEIGPTAVIFPKIFFFYYYYY